jgi:hypothetical protein
MTSNLIPMTSKRRRLVDEAIDAYVDWREESVGVWDSYARWTAAQGTDAGLAFQAYVAALDREERASEVYGGLIRRAGATGAALVG